MMAGLLFGGCGVDSTEENGDAGGGGTAGTGGTAGSGGSAGSGGTGANLCMGVICEGDGNECTSVACDPVDGECKATPIADGPRCNGDAGTCTGGDCILDRVEACGDRSHLYEDGDFPPAAWTPMEIPGKHLGTTSIVSVTTEPTEGNPGAYRKTVLHLDTTDGQPAAIFLSHSLDVALYDPSTDGEICEVRFFLDGTDKFDVDARRAGFTPFMLQDGTYYAVPLANQLVVDSETWERGSWTTGAFTRFDGDGPATPDFSAAGAPIQFGYLTGNSRPGTAVGTGEPISAVDNFKVEVFPPEP